MTRIWFPSKDRIFSFYYHTEAGFGVYSASYPINTKGSALRLKYPLHEDHSPPSSAKVQNVWSFSSMSLVHFHDVLRHRVNFVIMLESIGMYSVVITNQRKWLNQD
jgi:hypothetical protein